MPAPFAAYRDRLVKAVDRVHAERVRVEPRKLGNYGSAADPDRTAIDIAGPLRLGSGDTDTGGARRNFTSTIPVGKAELRLDRTLLPPGFRPVKGDHVIPLDRSNLPRFEVLKVSHGDIARLILTLAVIGTD